MNHIKIYAISFVVLVLCSSESDGLFFGFLLRLMLLKSAMFVGMPIAIGSFMIGQGIGFMGGSMAGGYGMLRASQSYHEAEKLKWTSSSSYGAPLPKKNHPIINFLKTKYPHDPNESHGKLAAILASHAKGHGSSGGYGLSGGYGSGGYGSSGGGYGHSVLTHDTGYLPVSDGHTKYEKGFNKGIFLGGFGKGFKSGIRHPYGGPFKYPHTAHAPSYGNGYSSVNSDHGFGGYGYESKQPAVAVTYQSLPSKGYGPSPSIFQRVMSFPTSFFSKKPAASPYGPKPPIHYIKPQIGYGYPQQVSSVAAGKSPYYQTAGYATTGVVQPETTLESYDGPGKEYTGIISGGAGYAELSQPGSSSYSTVAGDSDVYSSHASPGDYASDVSSVSVHEEQPSYSSLGGEVVTQEVEGYGHDQPKSEPVGANYFSNEYDSSSLPGIASDDLIQIFGGASPYPQKPNAYGGGSPLGDPMGPIEYGSYGSASSSHGHGVYSHSHNSHEPLDVQASIAYDVSKEFGTETRRSSVTKKSTETESQESIRVSRVVPAPNAIIEKFLEEKLEEKAKKARGEAEKKEAKHLIGLLRKAYIQQLIDSLNLGKKGSERHEGLPDFKPLPAIPNSTTQPPTSTTEKSSSSAEESSEKLDVDESTESWRKRIEIVLPKVSSGERPKRHSDDSSASTISSQEESDKPSEIYQDAEPAPIMNKEEHAKFLQNFLNDVKSFFVLVSALDQDTCLQKLVCDVHTRTGQPDLTTYESNIISTFRIMDTLVTTEEEDSSTVYRQAARVGEIGGSPEVCQKTYANCGYSASQIISLGQQVENTDSSNFSPMVFGDVENTATAMPRV